MSYIEESPIEVLGRTLQAINNQRARSQRRMAQEIRRAQANAAEEAQRRIDRAQREQTRRINDSISRNNARISSLEESTRRNLEVMDRRQREQMTRLTQRVYEDINTAQRQLSDRMDRQIASVQRHVDQRIDAVQGQVDALARSTDRRFDAMQGQVNDLSRRTDRRFDAVQGQINTLAQGMQEMANDINQRFKDNEREMARMKSDMNNIVRDINQRYASEDEQARATVETARALMDVVEQRTPLNFAPGYEAQDLRNRINNLTSSSNHGAALTAQAEEAILQIWQVESHALQEKAKHDAMVEIALTQVERVLTVVNENRVMEEPVEGGEPMEIENEFWSEGEYGRLEQELAALKAELDDNRDKKNIDEKRLEEITRRSAEIEARIQEIGSESVRKAILSEARVETAEDIVNAMETKGWMLRGGEEKPEFNYMGGEVDHDWRQGVCAVLENNLGDEITVIVDPDTDTQNRLIIHQETSKTGMTDKKVREQMQSIQAQMSDLGYQVGDSTSSVTHIPQMGSVDRLGQAHATEQIRKQLQH